MIVIFYINWKGSFDDMLKWEEKAKKEWKKVEGVKVLGVYDPVNIPWNRAWLMETDSMDKIMTSGIGPGRDNIRNTSMVILS
jgi:hypothetical protein